MKLESGKTYAVVSGDIVGSSRFQGASRQTLHQVMKQSGTELREFFGPTMPLDLDIYAGDACQFLLTAPDQALRAAIFYRALILAAGLKTDIRLAIGIGPIVFLPQDRVSEGDGPAFQFSGKLLQDGPSTQWMRFASADTSQTARWDAILGLLDALIRGVWTAKRSRAITGVLRGWSQERIASLWNPPITQPTVFRQIEGAHWHAILPILALFEEELGLSGDSVHRL